jgi:hypothetical protein
MKIISLIVALLASITCYAEVVCEDKMIYHSQTGRSYLRQVCVKCELREVYHAPTATMVVRKVCTELPTQR